MKVVPDVSSAKLRISTRHRCGLSRRFAQRPASPLHGSFQPLSKERFLTAVVLGCSTRLGQRGKPFSMPGYLVLAPYRLDIELTADYMRAQDEGTLSPHFGFCIAIGNPN